MSFAAPLVLLALAAIPALVWGYRHQQRRQIQRAEQFSAPALMPSVAPRRPGWRRHVPAVALGLALVLLVLAAAGPQRSVAVPVRGGQVMLADDVSSSMAATDVPPSRLGGAQRAAAGFLASMPATIRVGVLEFNQRATVLQSPTADHTLARSALAQLHPGGRTAIGDGIVTALRALQAAPAAQRSPAAIVLLSDGTSTIGEDPGTAARQAATAHVPVYTVSLGTDHGTIPVYRGRQMRQVPVPVDSSQLDQIAQLSGGRAFRAADTAKLSAVYQHLARQLGQRRVQRPIAADFAGGGLILLLLGGAVSLAWFGRLI